MVEPQPHPLFESMPPVLRDVPLDFHRDQERLWALEIEPIEVGIVELEWQLDLPFQRERFFAVTPREVADDAATG